MLYSLVEYFLVVWYVNRVCKEAAKLSGTTPGEEKAHFVLFDLQNPNYVKDYSIIILGLPNDWHTDQNGCLAKL